MNRDEFILKQEDINFYGKTEEEKKANEMIFDLSMEIDRQQQEIFRLNNIIDELSQYLEEDLKQQYRDCGYRNNIIREVYNKLNELKEK